MLAERRNAPFVPYSSVLLCSLWPPHLLMIGWGMAAHSAVSQRPNVQGWHAHLLTWLHSPAFNYHTRRQLKAREPGGESPIERPHCSQWLSRRVHTFPSISPQSVVAPAACTQNLTTQKLEHVQTHLIEKITHKFFVYPLELRAY